MKRFKRNIFWILSIAIVLVAVFATRDFDSRYGRSINGDGKAYYAYLPALFLYQDASFSFIDSMEVKYYPEDKSQFKDFRNKQKNGKFVNKTFPGLSILYSPFFFISWFVAWISGFALDGYSAPFQWGIALSHVVYYFVGLRFLLSFFRGLRIKDAVSYTIFTGLTFGTNCWYYLVYDHSVSHIHNFFLSAVLLWALLKWAQTKQSHFVGLTGIILCLLVITRPTNGIMLFFVPLVFSLANVPLKSIYSKESWKIKALWKYIVIGIGVLLIPFLFWKWQSDLWIVYSYNEEGFDFKHPHLYEFLFSYQKGWFVYTPLLFVFIVVGVFQFAKDSIYKLIYFLAPIGLVVYVLSSWWCWTYGSGFGQRPVIDYYPFISIGIALFLNRFETIKWIAIGIIPFCFLSMFQSYQIQNSILLGGNTTKEDYWKHFLQWKTDAPVVNMNEKWRLIEFEEKNLKEDLSEEKKYSSSVSTFNIPGIKRLVVKVKIGAKHKNTALRLVVSNKDGSFYQAVFLGDFVYNEPRMMEFEINVGAAKDKAFSAYIWNGDSDEKAKIEYVSISSFR